jgi:hypothetical protein
VEKRKISKYKALPRGLWYIAKGKASILDLNTRVKERGKRVLKPD